MRSRTSDTQRFGIFILGAGFSCPAGLPNAQELWLELRKRVKLKPGRERFQDDLQDYIEYRQHCDGLTLTPDELDFEDFLGFLDLEHHLRLRGADTLREDGNETQVLVKRLIGEIIAERTPHRSGVSQLYLDFATLLQPGDRVLTFNYDVLLERALERVGKPFRLFPSRYSSVDGNWYAEVDTSRPEVVVAKLHGSIDWFDKSYYLDSKAFHARNGLPYYPKGSVFTRKDLKLSKITDGPRFSRDPLKQIYRCKDTEALYAKNSYVRETPCILSPSTMKIVYADSFKEFWHGLGVAGSMNLRMMIIGYSMPAHDHYARQAIYRLVTNYQQVNWDQDFLGKNKEPLTIVDLRTSTAAENEFRRTYGFVDWEKARVHLDGFDPKALQGLLQ